MGLKGELNVLLNSHSSQMRCLKSMDEVFQIGEVKREEGKFVGTGEAGELVATVGLEVQEDWPAMTVIVYGAHDAHNDVYELYKTQEKQD